MWSEQQREAGDDPVQSVWHISPQSWKPVVQDFLYKSEKTNKDTNWAVLGGGCATETWEVWDTAD